MNLSILARFCAVFLLVGGWFFDGSTGAAAAEARPFAAGNERYAAGDYAGAAKAYEAQVKQENFSANLFYNLGDAYYRLGDRGRAILNYRRALALEPSHPEAAANLGFVTGGKPVSAGQGVRRLLRESAPWATALCSWLGAVGLLALAGGRRRRALGLGLTAGGFLLCALGAGLIWFFGHGQGDASRAVVVAEATPALYSPADNSKVVTSLAAGAEVRVLSEQGAWIYALLGDGATHAWLAADKIERLVPP